MELESFEPFDENTKSAFIQNAHNIINEIEEKYKIRLRGEHILWEKELSEMECNQFDLQKCAVESIIKKWGDDLIDRVKKYENKYINQTQTDVMMDFDTLINRINQGVAPKFKENPVQDRYFIIPFLRMELNFNPYKNNGNLLPSHFSYVNKNTNKEISCLKGETYIISQLYYINKWQDYDLIAPLFLLVFLSDFKKILSSNGSLDNYSIDRLIIHSKDLLKRHSYDIPDCRYKTFIPSAFYFNRKMEPYYQNIKTKKYDSENNFADFIVSFFNTIYDPYQMCYFQYPPQEWERARNIRDDALSSYSEWLGGIINGNY